MKRGQAATKSRWISLHAFGDSIKCTFQPSTEELGSCALLAMLQKPDLDYSSTPEYGWFWGSEELKPYHQYHRDPSFEFFSWGRDGLQESWNRDPLTTLKIVCYLRSDSRKGASNPEAFYVAALRLFKVEPCNLAYNVRAFAEFCSFRDLPVILHRLLHDSPDKAEVHKILKAQLQKAKSILPTEERKILLTIINMRSKFFPNDKDLFNHKLYVLYEKEKFKLVNSLRNGNIAAKSRRTLKLNVHKHKPGYKLLRDQISDFFFQTLKADLGFLKSQRFENISQAAKWCPSSRSRLERSTCLSECIARRFFPHEPDGYRVLGRLWKEVVAPLRRALRFVRVNANGTENWWKLPIYDIDDSNSLMTSLNIELLDYFKGRDHGMKKKVIEALLPHEIIDLLNYEVCHCDAVANLKWKTMISELSKQGKFKNSIAVVGEESVSFCPSEISHLRHALGLLISELSEGPWEGKIMVSGDEIMPVSTILNVEGEILRSKFSSLRSLQPKYRYICLFQVLDALLENACLRKLKTDEMVKQIFIFQDWFYFDDKARWRAMKEIARERFRRNGFPLPEIIIWTMRNEYRIPEVIEANGATLIEGVSFNIVKSFLEGDGYLSSQSVMEDALSGEKYENLKVYGNPSKS